MQLLHYEHCDVSALSNEHKLLVHSACFHLHTWQAANEETHLHQHRSVAQKFTASDVFVPKSNVK